VAIGPGSLIVSRWRPGRGLHRRRRTARLSRSRRTARPLTEPLHRVVARGL